MKINARLSTPQIIFTAVFVATIQTFVTPFAEWDKSIYTIFSAGILCIVGVGLAKIIFKDEN